MAIAVTVSAVRKVGMRERYPWSTLRVGMSFEIKADEQKVHAIQSNISYRHRVGKCRYIYERTATGVRVTRVK